MPGSPPINTSDPGTKPPPSTLSNSSYPLGIRSIIRSVLLGLKRNDDSIQLIGACGNLSSELREDLFKKLISIQCESKFRPYMYRR